MLVFINSSFLYINLFTFCAFSFHRIKTLYNWYAFDCFFSATYNVFILLHFKHFKVSIDLQLCANKKIYISIFVLYIIFLPLAFECSVERKNDYTVEPQFYMVLANIDLQKKKFYNCQGNTFFLHAELLNRQEKITKICLISMAKM